MLFVELALIRWTAENNVYLAYVTNLVLLASFLGIGAGFLRARSTRNLLGVSVWALAVLVGFVFAFPVSLLKLSGQHQLSGGLGLQPLPNWLSLSVIFVLTVVVLGGIAHSVARCFVLFPPLAAYRLDILGSLAGIVIFSALSFLQLPPVAWGLIAAGVFAGLLGRSIRWWQLPALAAVVVLLAIESLAAHQHWSPYYKVRYVRNAAHALVISVNNIPHQTAYPIATLHRIEPFYFFPYRHVDRGKLNNVLLVGAGSGNDVAVALSQGAKHIDAVEIDPEIQHLGSLYHYNRPYQDSRVTVHINDGRAFLNNTGTHYDLILFALPDSLTTLAGQANLRLENYLFTTEAMQSARAHLKPGGTFAMYNYYEPFLLDRYANTLATVYGSAPCVELGTVLGGRRQAVLTAAAGRPPNCARYWHGAHLAPATDDWPFPYLPSRTIPSFYLRWLAAIAVASLLLVRGAAGSLRRLTPYTDLAFMGAAFLLLETKNIAQFALLFGTTWLVNSLAFLGVLLSVLAAIEVASRFRLPRSTYLYAALAAALALAWAVPPASLLNLPPVGRFLSATALAFSPIFLANLIFSQRFRDTASSTQAFAANLLGAMLGGALEYLALVTGYRFLLIIVATLYAFAYIARPRRAQANALG